MICVDCKMDLSLDNFTTGKSRCKKCQYQYQKARKSFMDGVLIPLKNKLQNLQPLWATDNMRKSNHIGPEWGNQE